MVQAYALTTYGERMAEVYDQWPGVPQNTDIVVAFLRRLAGSGSILELGIGAGRLALPLAQPTLRRYGHGVGLMLALRRKKFVGS
jgi:hypothetical protein